MYRILEAKKIAQIPPEKIKFKETRYPRNAYQMHFEGWVVLSFDINAEGLTENILIYDSDAQSSLRGITENGRARKLFEKYSIKALAEFQYESDNPVTGLYFISDFLLPRSDDYNSYYFTLQDYGYGDLKRQILLMRDTYGGPAVCC